MKKLLMFVSVMAIVLVGVQVAPIYAQCTCGGGPESVTWNGWSFSFVRPCLTQTTTAGGRGGGIELQNGRFNGKSVFYKAHLPILNVKYHNNACGPYRDWQYGESRFNCSPQVSPGRCNGPATTNCANPGGGDVGSFCGVSVDTSNPNQLVLTTVLSAGWYRYQLEWYFYADGSFRPAMKWTAVPNGCLSNEHVHFAYWRIDFDIEAPTPNIIEESSAYGPLVPGYWETWDPIFVEMTRAKDQFGGHWWRIRNKSTNRAYIVYPPELVTGDVDGMSPGPGISDIWALHYNGQLQEETDDGGTFARYWNQLGKFIDYTAPADDIDGQDIVFWYGAAHYHPGTGVPPPCDTINGPYVTPDPSGPAW